MNHLQNRRFKFRVYNIHEIKPQVKGWGMENFAQRVRQLRKESGKTQTQMAAVFEISARQYQNYEGGGHYPDVPGLMKMADYFGVTTDYLLGRSDQRS